MSASSKIFMRNRALGYVSNDIPVLARYVKNRRENVFVTCVGRSFHTYGSSHLQLINVSDLHPEDITCIACDTYLVYTAAGNTIYAWRRGSELKYKYEGHEHPVKLLLPFGPHLVSIDENENLKLWLIKETENQLELKFDKNSFEITALMHPNTYLNKILFGSEQGSLQLWNLNTSKHIYTFKGWGSPVNVIKQSPAVNVVAIGLRNGHIILHNLKFDEIVMEFHQDWGTVTSLTFRLDNSPLMISGTTCGHLILWNLEEKKVFSQLLNAHDGIISGLECLMSEPLMVTSSADNSLKLWIFDKSDGSPRMLIKREGHSLPPTFIRFHGANGQNLLSAGGDSHLRLFHTKIDRLNKTLGKASYNKKLSKKKGRGVEDSFMMPPIVKFTSETTREKEWDNIVAIHLGIPEVTTWSYAKCKMGDLRLIHSRFIMNNSKKMKTYKGTPNCVHLTHCGNFVLVGYSTGHCDKFNIQSGIYRGSYGVKTAHKGSVRGVTSDTLNLMVITGGSDNFIKWWNFKKGKKPIYKLKLEDGVSFFTSHNESSLTAVALEDFSVVLIDNEGRNVIRKFRGHMGKLMDAAFSPDARWLVTAGMDCCIFTWDIPSGCLIDYFKVDAACTSLSFSPTGELLATTHVENLGVFLWSNRTLYEHVTLKPIKTLDDVPLVSLPSVNQGVAEVNNAEESDDEKSESAEQIDGLITLSNLASSRWQNLLSIDLIKKRNKPKELQVSKVVPFFLPTVPSTDVTFDLSAADNGEKTGTISSKDWTTLSAFGSLLKKTETSQDFRAVFEKLKSMGPSMIDHEINSLATADPSSTRLVLTQFMKMIKFGLDSKIDFELTQAYLGLFLKVHGEILMEDDDLQSHLNELKLSQICGWQKLENDLMYNLAVIQALKL